MTDWSATKTYSILIEGGQLTKELRSGKMLMAKAA